MQDSAALQACSQLCFLTGTHQKHMPHQCVCCRTCMNHPIWAAGVSCMSGVSPSQWTTYGGFGPRMVDWLSNCVVAMKQLWAAEARRFVKKVCGLMATMGCIQSRAHPCSKALYMLAYLMDIQLRQLNQLHGRAWTILSMHVLKSSRARQTAHHSVWPSQAHAPAQTWIKQPMSGDVCGLS